MDEWNNGSYRKKSSWCHFIVLNREVGKGANKKGVIL